LRNLRDFELVQFLGKEGFKYASIHPRLVSVRLIRAAGGIAPGIMNDLSQRFVFMQCFVLPYLDTTRSRQDPFVQTLFSTEFSPRTAV